MESKEGCQPLIRPIDCGFDCSWTVGVCVCLADLAASIHSLSCLIVIVDAAAAPTSASLACASATDAHSALAPGLDDVQLSNSTRTNTIPGIRVLDTFNQSAGILQSDWMSVSMSDSSGDCATAASKLLIRTPTSTRIAEIDESPMSFLIGHKCDVIIGVGSWPGYGWNVQADALSIPSLHQASDTET